MVPNFHDKLEGTVSINDLIWAKIKYQNLPVSPLPESAECCNQYLRKCWHLSGLRSWWEISIEESKKDKSAWNKVTPPINSTGGHNTPQAENTVQREELKLWAKSCEKSWLCQNNVAVPSSLFMREARSPWSRSPHEISRGDKVKDNPMSGQVITESLIADKPNNSNYRITQTPKRHVIKSSFHSLLKHVLKHWNSRYFWNTSSIMMKEQKNHIGRKIKNQGWIEGFSQLRIRQWSKWQTSFWRLFWQHLSKALKNKSVLIF